VQSRLSNGLCRRDAWLAKWPRRVYFLGFLLRYSQVRRSQFLRAWWGGALALCAGHLRECYRMRMRSTPSPLSGTWKTEFVGQLTSECCSNSWNACPWQGIKRDKERKKHKREKDMFLSPTKESTSLRLPTRVHLPLLEYTLERH